MSAITDGMITMRTMKASKSTAAASANPIDLMNELGSSMNAPNTEIMISAAAATTRAPWLKPIVMAPLADAPCTYSSRIRVTRNTW